MKYLQKLPAFRDILIFFAPHKMQMLADMSRNNLTESVCFLRKLVYGEIRMDGFDFVSKKPRDGILPVGELKFTPELGLCYHFPDENGTFIRLKSLHQTSIMRFTAIQRLQLRQLAYFSNHLDYQVNKELLWKLCSPYIECGIRWSDFWDEFNDLIAFGFCTLLPRDILVTDCVVTTSAPTSNYTKCFLLGLPCRTGKAAQRKINQIPHDTNIFLVPGFYQLVSTSRGSSKRYVRDHVKGISFKRKCSTIEKQLRSRAESCVAVFSNELSRKDVDNIIIAQKQSNGKATIIFLTVGVTPYGYIPGPCFSLRAPPLQSFNISAVEWKQLFEIAAIYELCRRTSAKYDFNILPIPRTSFWLNRLNHSIGKKCKYPTLYRLSLFLTLLLEKRTGDCQKIESGTFLDTSERSDLDEDYWPDRLRELAFGCKCKFDLSFSCNCSPLIKDSNALVVFYTLRKQKNNEGELSLDQSPVITKTYTRIRTSREFFLTSPLLLYVFLPYQRNGMLRNSQFATLGSFIEKSAKELTPRKRTLKPTARDLFFLGVTCVHTLPKLKMAFGSTC